MFGARPLRSARPQRSQYHSAERGQHHEDLPEVRKFEPGRSQVLRRLRHTAGCAAARRRPGCPAGRSGLPRLQDEQPARCQVLRRLRRRPGAAPGRRGASAPASTTGACGSAASNATPAPTCGRACRDPAARPACARCATCAGRPTASRCAAGSRRARTCTGRRRPLRRVRRGHPLLSMLRRAAGRGRPARVNYTQTFEVSQTSKVFAD